MMDLSKGLSLGEVTSFVLSLRTFLCQFRILTNPPWRRLLDAFAHLPSPSPYAPPPAPPLSPPPPPLLLLAPEGPAAALPGLLRLRDLARREWVMLTAVGTIFNCRESRKVRNPDTSGLPPAGQLMVLNQVRASRCACQNAVSIWCCKSDVACPT